MKTTTPTEEHLLKIIDKLQKTNLKMAEQIEQLQHRLDKLLNLLYGTKTEKTQKPKDPSENKPENSGKKNQNNHSEKTTNANGRRPLPKDIPREQVVHELPPEKLGCPCCKLKMQRMGKIITEQLEFKPAELFVIEHIRYKYSCQRCKNDIVTSPMPPQPIDKGLAGPALLAETLINKHCDHIPLHRQELRYARLGIDLPRSTLCDWVKQCAIILEPIVNYMRTDALLTGMRLFTDDTPIPVQNIGKTHTGRLWTYVGGGLDQPTCVIYDYTPTRSQKAAQKFLKDFEGYLHADAYPGYDVLYRDGKVIEIACWAHARRKFTDIIKTVKTPGIADIAVNYIGKLYTIERECEQLNYVQRKYYRRRYSKPILKEFRKWLLEQKKGALPKSPIGHALAYTLNHWRALCNYCRDGRLKIDNNTAERAIKPLVIGRKNWLFAGSHDGAKNAAIIYSLIETCKINQINAFLYLKDVLKRLPTTLARDLPKLAPYNWVNST